VPGYQKVGVVERVGAAVQTLRSAKRCFVTVSKVEGQFYPFGGHVSPAVTHRGQVWPLARKRPPVAASGLVLTQVGYNVGMRPHIEPGDAVVVLGDGLVGHWAAQTLQLARRARSDCRAARRRLARFVAGPRRPNHQRCRDGPGR
jgi:threonine dehydrogenase-like Zn-dependent dehydrogenase